MVINSKLSSQILVVGGTGTKCDPHQISLSCSGWLLWTTSSQAAHSRTADPQLEQRIKALFPHREQSYIIEIIDMHTCIIYACFSLHFVVAESHFSPHVRIWLHDWLPMILLFFLCVDTKQIHYHFAWLGILLDCVQSQCTMHQGHLH